MGLCHRSRPGTTFWFSRILENAIKSLHKTVSLGMIWDSFCFPNVKISRMTWSSYCLPSSEKICNSSSRFLLLNCVSLHTYCEITSSDHNSYFWREIPLCCGHSLLSGPRFWRAGIFLDAQERHQLYILG